MPRDGFLHPLYPNTVCEICECVIAAGDRMKPRKGGWAHTECLEASHE